MRSFSSIALGSAVMLSACDSAEEQAADRAENRIERSAEQSAQASGDTPSHLVSPNDSFSMPIFSPLMEPNLEM